MITYVCDTSADCSRCCVYRVGTVQVTRLRSARGIVKWPKETSVRLGRWSRTGSIYAFECNWIVTSALKKRAIDSEVRPCRGRISSGRRDTGYGIVSARCNNRYLHRIGVYEFWQRFPECNYFEIGDAETERNGVLGLLENPQKCRT